MYVIDGLNKINESFIQSVLDNFQKEMLVYEPKFDFKPKKIERAGYTPYIELKMTIFLIVIVVLFAIFNKYFGPSSDDSSHFQEGFAKQFSS